MVKPIASALYKVEHIQVIAEIIRKRLDALHLQVHKNRTYLIDAVDPSALYYLAQTFDVLGYKGWFLADTIEKRRALIKRAIELHRFKGTPWAVKEAIKSLGFQDVTILERVGLNDGYYNGLFNYDGSHTYGSEGIGEWATFKVIISMEGITSPLTSEVITALIALINEYKNVRSHLVGLVFSMADEDSLEMEDISDYGNFIEFADTLTGMHLTYDGTASYDEEYDYDVTGDSLQVTTNEPPPPLVTEFVFAEHPTAQVVLLLGAADSASIDWNNGDPVALFEPFTTANNTIDTGFDPAPVSVTFENLTSLTIEPSEEPYRRLSSVTGLPPELQHLTINGMFGYDLDLSTLVNLQTLVIKPYTSTSSDVTNVVIPETPTLLTLDFNGGNLTADCINTILMTLDAAGGENGTVDVRMSASTPPFGDGITAIINLIGKGWTVQWDI